MAIIVKQFEASNIAENIAEAMPITTTYNYITFQPS